MIGLGALEAAGDPLSGEPSSLAPTKTFSRYCHSRLLRMPPLGYSLRRLGAVKHSGGRSNKPPSCVGVMLFENLCLIVCFQFACF